MNDNKLINCTDDPFAPEADPYPPEQKVSDEAESNNTQPVDCQCSGRNSLTRRQALVGLSLVVSSPVLAQVDQSMIPCRPEKQKLNPCKHKFCKYYGGVDDYYAR